MTLIGISFASNLNVITTEFLINILYWSFRNFVMQSVKLNDFFFSSNSIHEKLGRDPSSLACRKIN